MKTEQQQKQHRFQNVKPIAASTTLFFAGHFREEEEQMSWKLAK